MNAQAQQKIVKARAALIFDHPFFGSLALRMIPTEAKDIETFATDGHRMYYNPDHTNKIPLAQVKTEICHEVMHNVLDHIKRQGARDHERWNRACDYPINQILHDLGMQMDNTFLMEPAFKGMSADHIYTILPPGNSGGSGGSGKGGPGSGGKAPNHIKPNPSAPVTAAEQRNWKIATAQAAQAAKMMGKLPGSLEQFVDELLGNKVDWREVLRQFMTQAFEGDFSWMHPNRMLLGACGILLPGLYSEKTKPIAVFKDISGSIDDQIQNAFNAEIRAIVQDVRPENTHAMYVDTRVARYDVFGPDDTVELVNIRGGGTSFVPPFEHLAKEGITPACAVYLTDMQGTFPEVPPDYPVLWLSIDKNAAQPPFGEMIILEM